LEILVPTVSVKINPVKDKEPEKSAIIKSSNDMTVSSDILNSMENNQIRPRSSLSSISGNRSFNISSTSSLPPLYEETNNNSPSKTPPKISLEVCRLTHLKKKKKMIKYLFLIVY